MRGVSVELSAVSGQLRRRTQRSFLEKAARPLFRQSQLCPAGVPAGHMYIFRIINIPLRAGAPALCFRRSQLLNTPSAFPLLSLLTFYVFLGTLLVEAGASAEASPVAPLLICGAFGFNVVSVRAGWYPRESGVCLTWDAESALFFSRIFSNASSASPPMSFAPILNIFSASDTAIPHSRERPSCLSRLFLYPRQRAYSVFLVDYRGIKM